jgi:hypothetical protein
VSSPLLAGPLASLGLGAAAGLAPLADAACALHARRAWQRLALDVFRPRLEALYRPRPPAGQPEGAEPAAPSFRDDVLGGCKLWRIPAQGPPVPKLPPPCIPSGELWAEARYLRERGVATPHAKDLYGLTDKVTMPASCFSLSCGCARCGWCRFDDRYRCVWKRE